MCKKPVIEIGDLNKEESMEYLIKKHNIKEVDVKKIFDLVGSRIVDLKTVADDFLTGQKFEGTNLVLLFHQSNLLNSTSYWLFFCSH